MRQFTLTAKFEGELIEVTTSTKIGPDEDLEQHTIARVTLVELMRAARRLAVSIGEKEGLTKLEVGRILSEQG